MKNFEKKSKHILDGPLELSEKDKAKEFPIKKYHDLKKLKFPLRQMPVAKKIG